MKNIAFLLPHHLDEDGRLTMSAGSPLLRLLEQFKDRYHITLILRQIRQLAYHSLPEGIPVIYDTAAPAETSAAVSAGIYQHWHDAWAHVAPLAGDYDCVISWSAVSPWCMATALCRINARRRLLFLPQDPRTLLTDRDIPHFTEACSHFDSLICASQSIRRSISALCGGRVPIVTARLPADLSAFREQALMVTESPFEEDTANLLTFEPLCCENRAELIPTAAAQLVPEHPELRWYILGEGERSAHLLQEIILNDVCEQVIPVEGAEAPLGCIPWCGGVVALHDENEAAAAAATLLSVPLFVMDETHDSADLARWLAGLAPSVRPRPLPDCIWKDQTLWENTIEGESDHED